MNDYVIYKIAFPDGRFYIGKAKNFRRRINEHYRHSYSDRGLKSLTINENNKNFIAEVLFCAPSELSDSGKQIWMDNMERIVIHNFSKEVYNSITGKNTNYSDYSFAKNIINRIMVNTQLY